MENNNTKTPEQIEALKKDWLNDPCWDIEYAEGFEAHKEELKNFSDEQEEKWRNERKLKEKQEVKKFFSLGLLESIWIDKIKYTKVPSGWIASIERSQSSDDGQLSVAVAAAICFIPEVPSVQPILAGEK